MRLRSVAVGGANRELGNRELGNRELGNRELGNRELGNRDGVLTPSLGSLVAVVRLSEPNPLSTRCRVLLGNENKLVRVQHDAGKLGQPRVFNELLALL